MWPEALEIGLRCQFPRFSRIGGWRGGAEAGHALEMEPAQLLPYPARAVRYERHRPEATLLYQLVERHYRRAQPGCTVPPLPARGPPSQGVLELS